jgi:hypothetical protein
LDQRSVQPWRDTVDADLVFGHRGWGVLIGTRRRQPADHCQSDDERWNGPTLRDLFRVNHVSVLLELRALKETAAAYPRDDSSGASDNALRPAIDPWSFC